MKKYLILIIFFFIILPHIALATEEIMNEKTIAALLGKSDIARGNIEGLEWDILLETTCNQQESSRGINVKVKNTNCIATFFEPSIVKGQIILMKQYNMWFIKPGLSKPVAISPRQKLIGGASNADIAATNYAGDYTATFVSTDSVRGVACYVLMLNARTSKVTYAGIKYWISKDETLGLKAEFYSVSGKLMKTAYFTYDALIKINGKPKKFISKMEIIDAIVDRTTVLTYTNITQKQFQDDIFNINTLV